MKLTKDEASILAEAINEAKYEMANGAATKDQAKEIISALSDLEGRIRAFAEDRRRTGRTSLNSWHNKLSRLVDKYKSKTH